MCEKPECPHRGDEMCSCKALQDSGETKRHLIENMRDLKAELSYSSLSAPFPYRFCVSGACKVCAGRLCVGVELPDISMVRGFSRWLITT